MSLVIDAVGQLGVKSKQGSPDEANPDRLRLRVGGYDRRKEVFKGWIEIEPFVYQGSEGSFCVMSRDQVRRIKCMYHRSMFANARMAA